MKRIAVLLLALLSVPVLGADIQLGWDHSWTDQRKLSFKLFQATGTNAAFTLLATTTNTTITLTNLSPGFYKYYVTAVDSSTNAWKLESDPSTVVALPDPVKPPAPTIWFMFLKTP